MGAYLVQPCVALGLLRGADATMLCVRSGCRLQVLGSKYLVDSEAGAISSLLAPL
jgi:hypothetical protein